jgi:hypothetical protein
MNRHDSDAGGSLMPLEVKPLIDALRSRRRDVVNRLLLPLFDKEMHTRLIECNLEQPTHISLERLLMQVKSVRKGGRHTEPDISPTVQPIVAISRRETGESDEWGIQEGSHNSRECLH